MSKDSTLTQLRLALGSLRDLIEEQPPFSEAKQQLVVDAENLRQAIGNVEKLT